MRIVFVSREVYPLASGGIGEYVTAAARLLARIAEVTVLTSSSHEARYLELRAARDPRLPPDEVRIAFVEEPRPEELPGWYDIMQCYASRVHERLQELYPEAGPDLIEFPDFLAEGCVTVQAAQALDPFLEHTCVCVRIHTSAEITEVLNGYHHDDLARQSVYAMERHALAHADRLIWPLGDVLATYRRFYAGTRLAPAVKIGYPYAGPAVEADEDRAHQPARPLRLLFLGRLERRKGVANLVEAARGLEREDFRLSLVGPGTPTGPLGVWMDELLELAIADDPRIELRAAAERPELAELVRHHDLMVVPSLWECGPYVALEALALNRPLAATPVGGLCEIVVPGRTGWLAAGTSRRSLTELLETVLERREEVGRLIRSGTLTEHARALCGERGILDCYERLAGLRPRARRPVGRGRAVGARRLPGGLPLVSAVVPYHRASRFVRETVESLLGQTYSRLEIVLVNDGSFEEQDWVLGELAGRVSLVVLSEQNRGLGAARNFGIAQSAGRYVLPFDADDLLHPEFVERCVAVLERRPELAYVTSWSRYMNERGVPWSGPLGYQPIGNESELLERENIAGSAEAVIRRHVFDSGFRYSEELTSSEDWHLYRRLRRAGRHGVVIPERLLYYRVRSDSMLRQIGLPLRQRVDEEVDGLIRRSEVRWTAAEGACA